MFGSWWWFWVCSESGLRALGRFWEFEGMSKVESSGRVELSENVGEVEGEGVNVYRNWVS